LNTLCAYEVNITQRVSCSIITSPLDTQPHRHTRERPRHLFLLRS